MSALGDEISEGGVDSMDLDQDLRLALRGMRKRPVVSAVVVLTLGLGIGANAILFASLYGSGFRPLPFLRPERLVAIHESRTALGETRRDVSAADLSDWMAASTTLEDTGAFTWTSYNLQSQAQSDDEPQRVLASRVTANLFPLLGVRPLLGRLFRPEEDRPGAPLVALISHRVWQERFASDPGIVGRTVRLDDAVHEIVGVMPEGFAFSHFQQLWTPLQLDPAATPRDRRELSVIARLREGKGVEDAQHEIEAVARRLAEVHPTTNDGWSVVVRPLREAWMPIPPGGELAVVAQLGMVGLVLLVVCANTTSILLAQAVARRREWAMRVALGAGRARLVRQALVESMLLALGGGLLGAILAAGSNVWLESIIATPIPYWLDFGLEAHGLAYVLIVTLLAGIAIGLLPAVKSSQPRLAGVLARAPRGLREGSDGRWLGRSLVVGEYAVALVVLVMGLLMVKSFANIQRAERGFAVDRVLTLRLPLTGERYRAPPARSAFLARLERRLRGLPELRAVGATSDLPVTLATGSRAVDLVAEGVSLVEGEGIRVLAHAVTPGFFDALSVPLRRGRIFSEAEAEEGRAKVALSESLAELLWPGEDPLHRRVRVPMDGGGDLDPERRVSSAQGESSWLEVIAVVGDIEPAQMIVGFGDMPRHRIYLPMGGTGFSVATPFAATASPPEVPALVLATRSAPETLVPEVRRTVRELDPSLPLFEVRSMRQVLDEFYFVQHFWSRIFSAIALLALLISGLGVYGMTSYSTSRRHREMGIRAALGADPRRLLRLVVRQGLATAAGGVGLGLFCAIPLAYAMEALLHDMRGLDLAVFTTVVLVLLALGLAASYVPARRATATAPVDALRDE